MRVLKSKEDGEVLYHGITTRTGDPCTLCGLMYGDGDDYGTTFEGIKDGKITCSSCKYELQEYIEVVNSYT